MEDEILKVLNRNLQSIWDADVATYAETCAPDVSFFEWYITTQRIAFPEYANWLRAAPEFQRLPSNTQLALMEQFHAVMDRTLPTITEDSMPGELANIVSGRVANILNLRGPNFITDAACASSFAVITPVESRTHLISISGLDLLKPSW